MHLSYFFSWFCCPLYTESGLAVVLEASWDLFTHQLPHSFGFGVYGTNTKFISVMSISWEEGGTETALATGAADETDVCNLVSGL